MKSKYRIVYVEKYDPCPWQIQERKFFVFWVNVYLSFSSVTTAGNELIKLVAVPDKEGGE